MVSGRGVIELGIMWFQNQYFLPDTKVQSIRTNISTNIQDASFDSSFILSKPGYSVHIRNTVPILSSSRKREEQEWGLRSESRYGTTLHWILKPVIRKVGRHPRYDAPICQLLATWEDVPSPLKLFSGSPLPLDESCLKQSASSCKTLQPHHCDHLSPSQLFSGPYSLTSLYCMGCTFVQKTVLSPHLPSAG